MQLIPDSDLDENEEEDECLCVPNTYYNIKILNAQLGFKDLCTFFTSGLIKKNILSQLNLLLIMRVIYRF